VACQRSHAPLAADNASRRDAGCYPLAQCNLSSWPLQLTMEVCIFFWLVLGGAVAFWRWSPQSLAFGMDPLVIRALALFYGVMLLLVLADPEPICGGRANRLASANLGRSPTAFTSFISCRRFWPCDFSSRHTSILERLEAVVVSLFCGFLTYGIAKIFMDCLERPHCAAGTPSATSSFA